jgi:cytochrome c oxidase subunit 4
MTIVKAFYIVGEFMHLKHEVKTLIWAILLPAIFVVWLLIALIYEGGHLY